MIMIIINTVRVSNVIWLFQCFFSVPELIVVFVEVPKYGKEKSVTNINEKRIDCD